MSQSIAEQRDNASVLGQECEGIQRLTGLVRVAMGRLGGRISPWLDEGLLMSHGLRTLLEITDGSSSDCLLDPAAVDWVVSEMRSWARASAWYRAAWPCRIAPLCSALAERTIGGLADREIAGDLGIDGGRLGERYAEAGLFFGVSPELLLPRRPAASGARDLTEAITELPIEQRRVLTLYFEDGLSFAEIAELLEVTAAEAQETYGRAAGRIRARVFGPSQTAEAGD